MQEESLQETSFSRSLTDIHHKASPDPLWASIWTPFGQPKSIQNRSGGELQWHHVEDLDFEGWVPATVELIATPNPAPGIHLYRCRTLTLVLGRLLRSEMGISRKTAKDLAYPL